MANYERTWLDANGQALPLEACTQEQLLARFRAVVANHQDERTAWIGTKEALLKRLKDHRKAKAEANKRADAACAAMKIMIEKFQTPESP